jgi:hypothetical protein
MIAEMASLVRRQAPHLDDRTVVWCVASIMGQALFYRLTRPATLRILGLDEFTPTYAAQLASHIARFATGGIAVVAATPRRSRRAT